MSKPDIDTLLHRGIGEVIIEEHLEKTLKEGKSLRVKFGIDPTAPDLHLGHTVPLRKLRQFQDAGHTAVLIIGDFTATIGDPSGRNETRKPLTEKQVKEHFKKYLEQAGKIIDVKKAEIHYNSEWYKDNPSLLLELLSKESVQRVLERDDFQKRMREGAEITLLEIIYPLLQGYDSVMVKSDLEIGGTDQKFNLLMGRKMQRAYGLAEQDIITLPLLEGTDGVKKMSKSYQNYIGLEDEPNQMFEKVMAIPDELIGKYYTLLTDTEREMADPREAKLELGRLLVDMHHGKNAGEKAKEEFIRVFSNREKPTEIPKIKLSGEFSLVDLLMETKMASSKSEARRLIEQGGVKLDDEKKSDPEEIIAIKKGVILQVGKHRFIKFD